ncbi:hypothetical protein [Rhodopirellula bahusiensis]|uniref:hypothetical protein n=1 Tax=Rhodopirellula bahusiensis TaxID=2014065 RepID=UPI003262FBA5
MSRDVLARYREALERQAVAEKSLVDCRVEVEMVEKEIALAVDTSTEPSMSKKDRFIAEHRGELEQSDLEFLSTSHHGAKEVARYSGISESSLKRMADTGAIEVRRTEAGHRRYCTVSVVRHLIEGNR